MWPAHKPYQPTVNDLHQNGRLFPPNYLHESWMDYLYWDSRAGAVTSLFVTLRSLCEARGAH